MRAASVIIFLVITGVVIDARHAEIMHFDGRAARFADLVGLVL